MEHFKNAKPFIWESTQEVTYFCFNFSYGNGSLKEPLPSWLLTLIKTLNDFSSSFSKTKNKKSSLIMAKSKH